MLFGKYFNSFTALLRLFILLRILSIWNCQKTATVTSNYTLTSLYRIFSTSSPTKQQNEKVKLSIAIMLPQDYIRLRNFNVCINKEMQRINKGSWSFIRNFYLERLNFVYKLIHFLQI